MRSKGWPARLATLHQKHGKLVRIGPNYVSVSNPAAIPVIYGTNPYYSAATVSKGRTVPSVIAMGGAQHTAVGKSAGRHFTTNSLLDYEPSIEAATDELVRVLERHTMADIANYLQCFAMDVLTASPSASRWASSRRAPTWTGSSPLSWRGSITGATKPRCRGRITCSTRARWSAN